ncbi:hypothetical protein M3689_05705 [Alkalihalophilus marmarensis]|uniref:hypothetical protein n=1 Tax=Alkalihalophilus marmarensis TaxID=521377 RepID=UPI00203D7410|nr:hypothetical protein [Alkalihalophilus marmarensis]MCM3488800.1 hypothetical protein [Alkalihalophilus marmarensis]
MSYIIQTRKMNNERGFGIDSMIGIDHENWTNYRGSDTWEKADTEAKSMIAYSSIKAVDIRVVKVVATYSSKVDVETRMVEE